MRPLNFLLVFALLLGAFLVSAPVEAGEKLRLQLKWRHQFQFAGYYIAQEKGWYREAGLEVEIKEAKPDDDVLTLLNTGNADYAIASPAGLIRHQKYPLVALAAVFQNSPSVLLVRRDSGIQTAHDLRGKRIMLSREGNAELQAMLHAVGIDANGYDRRNTSQKIGDLIDGHIDAMTAYLGNEPERMAEMGVPGRILRPQDYGVHFYSDVLYTLPEEIDRRPERARAFLEASLRGWRYAFEHVDETIDLILKHYNTQNLTREDLRTQASNFRELVQPQLVEIGYMSEARWQRIGEQLQTIGMLPRGWTLQGFLRDPRQVATTPWQWVQQHWHILAPTLAAAGFLLFLLFNWRLRRELDRRTLALAASTQNLELIRQAIFACTAVSVTDAEGNITEVSPAFEALSGYSREELIGQNHRILKSGTHDHAFWERYWQTISQGHPFRGEICNRNKQGELYWSDTSVTPVRDGQGKITGYLGVRHDITARKALAHEMDDHLHQMRHTQQTESRLRNRERLAALASMGTGIAHEINQPLTYLSATVQTLQRMLKRDSFEKDTANQMLLESRRQVERITRVLQNLRAMAEDDGLAHAVDWPAVLEGTLLVMEQRMISAGIFLQREIAPDLPRVRGNQGAFERVLAALFENAIAAMRPNQAAHKPQDLSIAMRPVGDHIEITLKDNGEGMSAQALSQAFDPYFTTRDPALHAGLGLSMALSTVAHYGGMIRLDSLPNEGTTVVLEFPVLDAENAARLSIKGALPRILWHPAMSVGHDHIDDEHRELFSLVNGMMDTVEAREPGDTHEFVLAALDALYQYTLTHFAHEEAIWSGSALPEVAVRAHLREHAELGTRLADLRQRCEADIPGADEAFVDFFREWVVNHVLISDMRMSKGIQHLTQEAERAARAG